MHYAKDRKIYIRPYILWVQLSKYYRYEGEINILYRKPYRINFVNSVIGTLWLSFDTFQVRENHTRHDALKQAMELYYCTTLYLLYSGMYSETSIYHSRMYCFSISIVQFLWSLNDSYLNYGNEIHISHPRFIIFPHLLVRILSL